MTELCCVFTKLNITSKAEQFLELLKAIENNDCNYQKMYTSLGYLNDYYKTCIVDHIILTTNWDQIEWFLTRLDPSIKMYNYKASPNMEKYLSLWGWFYNPTS